MSDMQSESTFTHPSALSAVRTLAGRLAHDFNNLITPLLAYPQLVRRDLPAGASGHALLDVMEKTAEDIARICQQLAHLGPDPQTLSEGLQLQELIGEVVDELQGEARECDMSLVPAVESDLPPVWMGRSQAKSILLALMRNALAATGAEDQSGGIVTIAAGRHTADQPRTVTGGQMPPGDYVRIDVIDGGPGISDEARLKLFEPLYTTNRKRRVRGSGLGLSIAYALVFDAQGFIDFESVPGRGTTFSVYLPVTGKLVRAPADEVPGSTSAPVPESASLPWSTADAQHDSGDATRILICDDEHVIVELFQLMIRSSVPGVEVDEAANGQQGLDLFRARHHQVVMMDLHMPIMDGQTAFRAIEAYCASTGCEMPAVIFCTGYAPPEGIRRLTETGGKHALLLKPVETKVLIDTVKSKIRGGHGLSA